VWGAGKVGFAGPIRRFMETDTFIVRVDESTGEPWRHPVTGFCQRVKLGEPGEAIGRVKSRALLTEYLNNEKATNEKIMHDVFVKGDMWQKMGDLVVMEPSGWVRFHDRMGDTFRWKGENVSAGEVRDHIAKLNGVLDAVVYGVKLDRYVPLFQHPSAKVANVMKLRRPSRRRSPHNRRPRSGLHARLLRQPQENRSPQLRHATSYQNHKRVHPPPSLIPILLKNEELTKLESKPTRHSKSPRTT
jgi:acyl-CoA synthetase (AMP-forming)/AMP-acid ligase II